MKGIRSVRRAEELWMESHDIIQEAVIKTIPKISLSDLQFFNSGLRECSQSYYPPSKKKKIKSICTEIEYRIVRFLFNIFFYLCLLSCVSVILVSRDTYNVKKLLFSFILHKIHIKVSVTIPILCI